MSITRLLIRTFLFALTIVASAATLPASAQAQAATYNFDIPAQSLATALEVFGRTCNQQLVFDKLILRDKQSNALVGHYTAVEGITRLLEGSGLTFKRTAKGVLAIEAIETPSTSVRVHPAYSEQFGQISEIIVTAQKKSERLQDVPVPVSVIDTAKLADNNIVLLRDYYSEVPGLAEVTDIYGQQNFAIRGITTGGVGVVAVVVDGVTLNGQLASSFVPDIDAGDLDRIEVLRGPQGTLYGANSLGGLINFVTKDPTMDGASGRVETGVSSAKNGTQLGYQVRAAANIPLTDNFAIRVSGFERQEPGYLDNPTYHLTGVNEAQSDGARVSALWVPASDFSVKLNALYQYTRSTGDSHVDVGAGEFDQNTLPGTGALSRVIQADSLVMHGKMGAVNITSVTGYNVENTVDSLDYSCCFGPLVSADYPVDGAPLFQNRRGHSLSEELRFEGSLVNALDWLIGGIYRHENLNQRNSVPAVDTTTLRVLGTYYTYQESFTYTEYGAFANLTYHLTDQLDLSGGVRYSHLYENDGVSTFGGNFAQDFYGSPAYAAPGDRGASNPVTYLGTLKYKFTPDLMAYGRISSGFQPGGGNGPPSPGTALPPQYSTQYKPSTTVNYELGLKGEFLDRTLSVDASVYHIDWKDIIVTGPGAFYYLYNGSKARSDGVELALTARPVSGLTVTGWVAYDRAKLTQDFPPDAGIHALAGDRLPNSSPFSGSLSINQDYTISSDVIGFVGAGVTYVDNRLGQFVGTPQRQLYPSYVKADLRAGVKVQSWTANIYVNNVANAHGLIGGGIGSAVETQFDYISPRIFGITLSKTF